MTIYCAFCPAEAVRYAVHRKGTDDWSQDHKTPLCCTCGEAYECGSDNPHVEWQNINSADDVRKESNMYDLAFSCTLGLEQDTCGKHCLDPVSPHQQLGGCPSCVHRTKGTPSRHANPDLPLVQKYIRYMELYEARLTQPLRPIEQHALDQDQADLLCSIQPYGDSIAFLESLVALTSWSPPQDRPPTRYPNHEELCMAIALWMIDRPSL